MASSPTLEQQLPGVMESGLITNKPVQINSDLTVTGTTNIAAISLTDLTVSGNTVIGNATSDTLAVTGASTFAAAATAAAVTVTATGITTGKGVSVTDLAALTTGIGINVTSAATAITGAGRLIYSAHTGTTGTSATLNEFTSAATDETIVATVGATAALAGGKVLNVSGAAVTTGTLLDISDNTAHTTGTAVNVVTNSSDTGTRSLVYIKQDHASATGATPLEVVNDSTLACIKVTGSVQSTHFQKIMSLGGVTLWASDGTTGQGNLSGTAGDIIFNGGSNKPEYCTGTTNWTALV